MASEKLDVFSKITKQEAYDKRDDMRKKIDASFQEACDKAMAKATQKKAEIIQEETDKAEQYKNREILHASTEAKHSLIDLRNQLTDELFTGVLDRLADFIETDEYLQSILQNVEVLTKSYQEPMRVFLCGRDMPFKAEIEKIQGVAEVVEGPKDMLGGFQAQMVDKPMMFDQSYKQLLADARATFVGFKITD